MLTTTYHNVSQRAAISRQAVEKRKEVLLIAHLVPATYVEYSRLYVEYSG
jgi:hypothetical protein